MIKQPAGARRSGDFGAAGSPASMAYQLASWLVGTGSGKGRNAAMLPMLHMHTGGHKPV
jgi:hypothetical protein